MTENCARRTSVTTAATKRAVTSDWLMGPLQTNCLRRHRGSGRHGRIHVHDPVDPYFGAGAETRPVEDAGAGGNEDGLFHGAAREMRVGADQDMVGEADRMSGSAAQHGLFHDDAVPADGDGAPFGDEHRAEQHAALGADGHVAADGGGGGDVGGFVDAGSLALVFEQHGRPSQLRLEIGAWRRIISPTPRLRTPVRMQGGCAKALGVRPREVRWPRPPAQKASLATTGTPAAKACGDLIRKHPNVAARAPSVRRRPRLLTDEGTLKLAESATNLHVATLVAPRIIGLRRPDSLPAWALPQIHEDCDGPFGFLGGKVLTEEVHQLRLIAGHDEEHTGHVLVPHDSGAATPLRPITGMKPRRSITR